MEDSSAINLPSASSIASSKFTARQALCEEVRRGIRFRNIGVVHRQADPPWLGRILPGEPKFVLSLKLSSPEDGMCCLAQCLSVAGNVIASLRLEAGIDVVGIQQQLTDIRPTGCLVEEIGLIGPTQGGEKLLAAHDKLTFFGDKQEGVFQTPPSVHSASTKRQEAYQGYLAGLVRDRAAARAAIIADCEGK